MTGMSGEPAGGGPITGINVTPLVDVVLVMLIIFMVTATLIVSPSIQVVLPKAAAPDQVVTSTLALTVDQRGAYYLNGRPATPIAIRDVIREMLRAAPNLQAVISADRRVHYGAVITLIDLIKQEGVHKFALNIERIAPR